jgi:hypothetical protein
MTDTRYRNRQAVQLENDKLRVTVLVEGGHVAEILHKQSGLNPLWTPPWPSIEPSTYDRARHPEYGADAESKLLAGIMGHNLCLDIFGGPSPEEAAAGMTVHGEASVVRYAFELDGAGLIARATLPEAGLKLERRLQLASNGMVVRFSETVENLAALDRPVAWTQHVTLGPPFLEKGSTQFHAPATRSKVIETDFAGDKGLMKTGAEFDWPNVPHKDGGAIDLRVYTNAPVSGGFTTHLMDPHREQAFFVAFSPSTKVLFGYVWKRTDFPWLGIWEENYSRTQPPWNGKTLTRGMEFGASPMPETRRQMIERGSLFGVPAYRWISARTKVRADYCAFLSVAPSIPETVSWDGGDGISPNE